MWVCRGQVLRIRQMLRAGCALPEPFLQHQARPPAKGAGMSAGGSGDECSERASLQVSHLNWRCVGTKTERAGEFMGQDHATAVYVTV
jgi:hypothetical protein